MCERVAGAGKRARVRDAKAHPGAVGPAGTWQVANHTALRGLMPAFPEVSSRPSLNLLKPLWLCPTYYTLEGALDSWRLGKALWPATSPRLRQILKIKNELDDNDL